jgi:hypothetical protein
MNRTDKLSGDVKAEEILDVHGAPTELQEG